MNIENPQPTSGLIGVIGLLAELHELDTTADYDALLEFHDVASDDVTRAEALDLVNVFTVDGARGVDITPAGVDLLLLARMHHAATRTDA